MCLSDVHFAYAKKPVLRGLSLDVARGEMVALLGPNGSGKTTILRLLTGALRAQAGAISIDGRRRQAYSRRALAQRIAVVPQELYVTFDFPVRELVLMGRAPHLPWWREEGPDDRRIAQRAMADTGTEELAERRFWDLSGGERQRVVVAMALAQQPRILLLDEPTHNLDIAHQAAIFDLIRRLNRERGVTVFAAIHDINLAALYCDRLILLREGRVMVEGPPEAVVTEANLRRGYGAAVQVFPHPLSRRPQVALVPAGALPRGEPGSPVTPGISQ